MAYIRMERATGPLDGEVKARLRGDGALRVAGYASTGSDQGAATCLSRLVHAFIETGGHDYPTSPKDDGDDEDGSQADAAAFDRDRAAAKIVREMICPAADMNQFRRRLAGEVSEAAEGFAWLRSSCGGSAFRRAVMARLRDAGYNAGICKASWETSGGLTGGSYEYIVDLEFAAEFEVARATEGYKEVVAALPRVAVAGEEAVRAAVRAVADAARRSLRATGLHVPPWRKSRYMLAKWVGPYRRTANPVPTSLPTAPPGGDVKCRAVGFPAAEGLVAAPTARTR
ncbi:plant-specific domain TIGR01615 family protein [Musa troglodytarum]|uniref:Plant-specific domain TIGR01615 family protein n=1 Tax=Musa troglodytarum TaxID=320322 RepID=A0A9E7JGX3_9LILI|nr:plant-specific domain TIGR01615 family protein [Musa troglodytarum]